MIFSLFHALLLLPIALTLHIPSSAGAAESDLTLNGEYNRPLMAAKRSQKLSTRNLKGCLSHDHQLHYVDENTYASESQFAAKVGAGFKAPALLLEDIEDRIQQIDCLGSTIYLSFSTEESLSVGKLKWTKRSFLTLRHAHEEFKNAGSFFLITSHNGCNKDGEQDSHMVFETSLNVEERLIILSVSRVPWKSTLKSMQLDFGKSNDIFELRRHRKIQPRQATTSTSGASAASISIAYPAAPTSTPAGLNVTANINKQYLDTSVLPPGLSLGQLTVKGPMIPAGFDIKCKNCTIQGSIELVAGSFNMNLDSNADEGMVKVNEAVIDYVEHGYMEFRLNNFMVHVELDSTVTASEQLTTYTAPLPTIPITPFQLPGIASVGPQFVPQLSVGFQLSGSLEFTYGFDVVVPNNSSITLNVKNITQYSYQGFDNTKITAIPFQAASADITLTTTGGFQPQVLAGISFFDGKATAGAGLFLDLPKLTAAFSTLSHVNANYETANTSSSTANKALDAIYDTLTHIDASVDLGLGVTAQAEVEFGDYSFEDNDPYTVLSEGFALPTACISFDVGKKTFGVPSATALPQSSDVSTNPFCPFWRIRGFPACIRGIWGKDGW